MAETMAMKHKWARCADIDVFPSFTGLFLSRKQGRGAYPATPPPPHPPGLSPQGCMEALERSVVSCRPCEGGQEREHCLCIFPLQWYKSAILLKWFPSGKPNALGVSRPGSGDAESQGPVLRSFAGRTAGPTQRTAGSELGVAGFCVLPEPVLGTAHQQCLGQTPRGSGLWESTEGNLQSRPWTPQTKGWGPQSPHSESQICIFAPSGSSQVGLQL